jgi:hypothetical protein
MPQKDQYDSGTPVGGGNAAEATRNANGVQITPGSKHTSGGSSRSRSASITPKTTAYSQLDAEFIKLFGYRASKEQKAQYYNALHKQEKMFATRSKSRSGGVTSYDGSGNSTSTSSDVSSSTNYLFDTGLFLQDFVIKFASDEIKAGKTLGGMVGQNYAAASQYASDMGISTNPDSLLKDTINLVQGKTDLTKLQNDYRDRASIKYSAFSDLIKANPNKSLRDLAQDQLDTIAQMTDTNINDLSFNDTTVNKVLSASKDGKGYIMNNSEVMDFVRKNDARFQYSKMAHTEAANLAQSFAKSFGFGV